MNILKLASYQEILGKSSERENTVIGFKGVYLSGGEQQRTAIAHVILKDAKVVILDKASAATDANNEYQIQKAFADLIVNKTVIIITHRLSSVEGVGEIPAIDKGAIVERGNGRELTTAAGQYKRLRELYASVNEWRAS